MRQLILAGSTIAAALAFAAPALACAPLIATDPVTGQTYGSGSDEWKRREQATWRAGADTVFIAEVREGRMIEGGEIEFTLTPITSAYGGATPGAALLYRWNPGHTCNAFTLNLTDFVVVFADFDEVSWSIVGLTIPDQLQDQPPDFQRTVREVHRRVIQGPPLPE